MREKERSRRPCITVKWRDNSDIGKKKKVGGKTNTPKKIQRFMNTGGEEGGES